MSDILGEAEGRAVIRRTGRVRVQSIGLGSFVSGAAGAVFFAGVALAQDAPVLPPARPEPAAPAATAPAKGASAEAEAAATPAEAATTPAGRKLYLQMIEREAKARGLPSEVADAVARVESGYDPGVVGGVGERGLMQVMPSTAAMLGFTGTPAQLADPATNIRLGVTYLAGAWKLANGDLCRALMKYRAGHNEERMSPLSVEYCRRAKGHLAAIGSPLGAGAVPTPNYFPAGGSVALGGGSALPAGQVGRVRRVAGRLVRSMPVRTVSTSRRFWAAHAVRIRAIEARLRWKRGGIMAPG